MPNIKLNKYWLALEDSHTRVVCNKTELVFKSVTFDNWLDMGRKRAFNQYESLHKSACLRQVLSFKVNSIISLYYIELLKILKHIF